MLDFKLNVTSKTSCGLKLPAIWMSAVINSVLLDFDGRLRGKVGIYDLSCKIRQQKNASRSISQDLQLTDISK